MPPTPIRFLWAFLYTALICFYGLMPFISCILFVSKNGFGVDCDLGHSKVTSFPFEQSPAISSPQSTGRLCIERLSGWRGKGQAGWAGNIFQDPGWPWGGPAPNARNFPALQATPPPLFPKAHVCPIASQLGFCALMLRDFQAWLDLAEAGFRPHSSRWQSPGALRVLRHGQAMRWDTKDRGKSPVLIKTRQLLGGEPVKGVNWEFLLELLPI